MWIFLWNWDSLDQWIKIIRMILMSGVSIGCSRRPIAFGYPWLTTLIPHWAAAFKERVRVGKNKADGVTYPLLDFRRRFGYRKYCRVWTVALRLSSSLYPNMRTFCLLCCLYRTWRKVWRNRCRCWSASVSVYVAGTVFALPYAVLRFGMEGFGGLSDLLVQKSTTRLDERRPQERLITRSERKGVSKRQVGRLGL